MGNGDNNYNLGKEIGELKGEVRQGFKYLGEKIGEIASITTNQENRLRKTEQWQESHNEVRKEKKSAVLYLVWFVAILGGITGFVSAVIK